MLIFFYRFPFAQPPIGVLPVLPGRTYTEHISPDAVAAAVVVVRATSICA